jgi:hypothetical protein
MLKVTGWEQKADFFFFQRSENTIFFIEENGDSHETSGRKR